MALTAECAVEKTSYTILSTRTLPRLPMLDGSMSTPTCARRARMIATYDWPWAKHWLRRSINTRSSVLS
eukprot:37031-Eustigmatos_ZCMA.PRE.1